MRWYAMLGQILLYHIVSLTNFLQIFLFFVYTQSSSMKIKLVFF